MLSEHQRSWLTFYDAETAKDGYDLGRAVLLLTGLTRQELEPALAIRAHVHLSAALRGLRRLEAANKKAQRALQLASASPEGSALLHLVHQELGLIARDEGDVERASYHLRRTIELGTAVGDRLVVASAFNGLGTVLQKLDPRQAITVLEAGAARLEGDAVRRAQVLNNLGLAYANVGDWARSQQSFERSLEIKRAAADLHGQALSLLNVARVYQTRQQPFAARNALPSAQRFSRRCAIPAPPRRHAGSLRACYVWPARWNRQKTRQLPLLDCSNKSATASRRKRYSGNSPSSDRQRPKKRRPCKTANNAAHGSANPRAGWAALSGEIGSGAESSSANRFEAGVRRTMPAARHRRASPPHPV